MKPLAETLSLRRNYQRPVLRPVLKTALRCNNRMTGFSFWIILIFFIAGFDIHKRWHVDWISSTTGCHIRPMQTFSLLSFILESGWPCIHLDWGSKYDLRSRQKNHPVKTGNDYIIAPKYDWTTPGPGDGKIMERALFQGRCKYGNGNSKARIMERECFECCVKERCAVKFVSLRNRRKWIYCEPGCKGFCNA